MATTTRQTSRQQKRSHIHRRNLCQAAIDQLLEPDVLDAIVGEITPAICEGNPTEQCPAAVDVVIKQGLPMLAAAGDDSNFGQVRKSLQNNCKSVNMGHCDKDNIDKSFS